MNLIINADDFGLTLASSQAIKELAELGVLSSTSVMVNMPYASEIKSMLSIDRLGVGLHFNLTQGKPVSNPNEIPSLVNAEKSFYPIKELKKKIKNGSVKREHVLKELQAQFSLLYELIGESLNHIDSHQDINKISFISDVLCNFSKTIKRRLGLRVYNKCYLMTESPEHTLIQPDLFNITEFGLKRVLTETVFRLRRKKLSKFFNLPDGILITKQRSTRDLLNRLIMTDISKLPKVTYEVMCHPATSTDGLAETSLLDARVQEYHILKSDAFREFAQSNCLVNFSDLGHNRMKPITY